MKRFLVVIFLTLMLILAIRPVFAAPHTPTDAEIEALNKQISERKDKIKEIEKSIEVYKNEVTKKRAEAVSLSNQLSIIDNRITQTELDIDITEQKLETIKLEIQILNKAIKEKEEAIARQQEIIGEFIRSIHSESDKTLVEILAIYDNFSDFYNRLQYLQTIERDLGDTTKSLKLAQAELETRQKETEHRKQSYQELNTELVDQKENLKEQSEEKVGLLTETKASEQKFQTLLANQKKQYQAIEGEIGSIERDVRKKLEAKKQNAEKLESSGNFTWPAPSRVINAYFHDVDYPFRQVFEHSGIDIRAAHGTVIRAAGSGYVAQAKRCGSWQCYSYILIVHGNGLSTLYGHMSNITVSVDEFVTKGDAIGYSGGTPKTPGAGPFVTGAHLHFEFRKNGIPVNPLNYLSR